jgi:GNAT superfamily N-acetyltransferase
MGLDLRAYAREWADLPHDAGWAWRDAGLHGVGAQLRQRLVDPAYRRVRYLIVERVVSELKEVPPPPGVRIAPLAAPDSPLLAPLLTAQALREVPARLASDGRACLVAWKEGRPIGVDWISRDVDLELDGLEVPLPADAVYTSGLFVSPGERGHGVGAALVSRAGSWARDWGCSRIWSAAAPGNPAALPVIERVASCVPVGEAWLVRTPGRIRRGYEPARNASAATK